MMQKKLNKLRFILNYDLANKYISKTCFAIPKVEKVSVALNFKDVAVLNDTLLIPLKERDYKIKSFIMFYLYFGMTPLYRLFNKINSLGLSRGKQVDLKELIEVVFSSSRNINSLFYHLLLDNDCLINEKGANIFNNFLVTPAEGVSGGKLVHFLISLRSFENFDKVSLLVFNDNQIKNCRLRITFQINSFFKFYNIKNLLHNLPFLWING